MLVPNQSHSKGFVWLVGAGPGGGPEVRAIDGTKLGQKLLNGQISDTALLAHFFGSAPTFTNGIFVAVGDLGPHKRLRVQR